MASWAATSLTFLVATGAIIYTVLQYRHNLKVNQDNAEVNRARFWLDIRQMFADHEDVHRNLQKGGPWYQSDIEPSDPKQRARVVSYLSLLEQVEFMLNKGLIDEDTIDATLIPYRVRLLLQNGVIKRCLLHGEHRCEEPDWEGFKDEKPDWVWFKALVDYFDGRYYVAGKHNFPYRDMLNSVRGGGPEIALVDPTYRPEKVQRRQRNRG